MRLDIRRPLVEHSPLSPSTAACSQLVQPRYLFLKRNAGRDPTCVELVDVAGEINLATRSG